MELTILSGSAHLGLSRAVANHMGRALGETTTTRFADSELDVQIGENVRRRHVVIIQPTPPPAENWLELFLLMDAAVRASAAEITVVMPYMGYARQDRKDAPRKPISAAAMLKLLVASGANRVCTIDLHAAQTQAAISAPFDNLYFSTALLRGLGPRNWKKVVLVSPDAGGIPRCRALAKKLGCPIAFIDKRRERANESEVMHVVGRIRGREAIILDDMVDTAGSLVKAAEALLAKGATAVSACCTHPVLSPKSIRRLAHAPLRTLVVADTIPISAAKRARIVDKLRVVSCAPMLGDAILRIHSGESLAVLFPEAREKPAHPVS
ncbi:ribose-phosphate pyrophosphokinase [Candidatus Uhrbacteria bacterium]|nr:ribose-phosphate pyrophosphokinase [Candidatus Uhrbacteria bacterium]